MKDTNDRDKIVAGYIRVSTNKQAEKGSSLQVQRERIFRKAERLGLDKPFIFEDKGESGTKSSRKQYTILKEEVKYGKVSTIIILSVSRLGRDLLEMLTFIKECEKMGVRVLAITEGYDSTKPHTKLHLHILGAIAENFIQENSGRIKASLERTKKEGKRYSKEIPIGYKLGSNNKLKVSEEDRQLVKRMKNLKTRGHSLNNIAKKLNEEGIKTKNGKKWYKELVHHYIHKEGLYRAAV
jgi:site-specific DNA recombinase